MTAGSRVWRNGVAWRATARIGELAVRLGRSYVELTEAARVALVFVGALVVLLLRRPEAILRAEFIIEDGAVFYIGTYFGSPLEVVVRPYAGYQNLLPRVVAFLERLVPIEAAPLVGSLAAIALLAALAAFLASSRLAPVVRDPRLRVGLAGLLVGLPGTREIIGVMANLQHFAPLYLLALAFARAPRGRLATALDLLALAAVALTGPYGVILQPLFWWRAWRRRDRYSIALVAILAVCTAAQLASLAVGGRDPNLAPSMSVVLIFAYRLTAGVWLGSATMAEIAAARIHPYVWVVPAAALGVALAWVWWRGAPRRFALPLLFVWWAIALGALIGQHEGLHLAGPSVATRYFVAPTAIMAVIVFSAAWCAHERAVRLVALALAAIFVVAVVRDFRLAPYPEQGWARHAPGCIGGPDPCSVPVWDPRVWTIRWPGSDGPWQQPRPGD